MKCDRKQFAKTAFFSGFPVCLFLILFAAAPVMAAESGEWRTTYDEIMLWVNFAIFVFVIYKFGKDPLMDFLTGQKKDLENTVNKLEKEKSEAVSRIQNTMKQMDESNARFADIRQRIIEQGEKRRKAIIADAHDQSRYMIEMAKRKTDGHILQAQSKLKSELADMAFEKAMERLPGMITEEDNQRQIDAYIAVAGK